MRAAVGGDQDRGDRLAEAAPDIADRRDTVAAIEVIVHQEARDIASACLDRVHRGVRV
jgi:hypothetical protein